MYQIDVTTVASSLPTPAAAGTPGYFTDGDPGTGTPATIVPADFLNAVQGELLNLLSSAGITPSKTDRTQVLAAIKTVATGRLLNVQTFTGSGTYTPTPGTTSIVADIVGGGGGGGGCGATGASTCAASGGGACGSYIRTRMTSGFSGATVTIGAGGTAGAAGANNGGNGGSTSFGSLLAFGGVGGAGNTAFTPPLSGGIGAQNSATASGGTILNLSGAPGTSGYAFIAAAPIAGIGGSGPFGSGGSMSVGNAPNNPVGYGGGGGGVCLATSQSAKAGIAGAQGVVIIYEYA